MLCIPFFSFNKGKQWGNAASPNTETFRTGCLADLPLNITGALTDASSMKQKMKFDSCLSFQTAELTDDLPVWLASMLNSSFQLHSASGIQWWESYRNWTGRAVSRVSLKLTDAQNTCNLHSTDQFFSLGNELILTEKNTLRITL